MRITQYTSMVSIALVAVLVSSCITTPVTVTSSTTPMQEKKIIMNYGPVQGTNRAWSLFGLWMIGRPDIAKAIQDALKKKGGDALINVTCYEKTAWYFLFSFHWVVVEGEAVSYEKKDQATGKGKKTDTTGK
ncbi:MAG TPA: hypothetical protein PLA65_07810 [Spirochaetota bacterium]|nr:hypothetical protein [Spirochaetota bacterium]HPG49910.1 hypothetical protein [Spirochaetota bacterium]HPN11950.1 hypothetical protein [Spirochaetota bacterium]